MRIEHEVRVIVESMRVNYVFDNWAAFNVRADNIDFPCVVYVCPASGVLKRKNGMIRNSPNVMVAFLNKTEYDFDSTENNDIVEECLTLGKEFIARVAHSESISISGDVGYRVVYDYLDVNCTGVVFECTINEVKGECERMTYE